MGTTKTARDGRVTIPIPGPYRLALSAATAAAHRATAIRKGVRFDPVADPSAGKNLDFKSIQTLFDYFEQAMVCAALSFQALEAFANISIDESLRDPKTVELEFRGQAVKWTSEEIQRQLSTEEKYSQALPTLTRIDLPKDRKLWASFKRLKRVRDSTVHLKSADFYVKGHLDRESLLHQLLDGDPRQMVRVAIDMMRHFTADADVPWLEHAEAQLKPS